MRTWKGEAYLQDGRPLFSGPIVESLLVGEAKHNCVVFLQKSGNDVKPENCYIAQADDLKRALQLQRTVTSYFPEVPVGNLIKLVLVMGKPTEEAVPPLSKLVIERLSLVLKSLAKLDPSSLADVLFELQFETAEDILAVVDSHKNVVVVTGSESADERAAVEVPQGDQGNNNNVAEAPKKGKGGKRSGLSSAAKKEVAFTEFYSRIYENMKENRKRDLNGGKQATILRLDPDLTLDALWNRASGQDRFVLLVRFLQGADQAVRSAQNLAIYNAIIQGHRLHLAKMFWDDNRNLSIFRQHNVTTWGSFLQHVKLDLTEGWANKLIALFELWSMYPNILLVDNVSVHEILENMKKLREMLQSSRSQAEEWRLSEQRQFATQRESFFVEEDGRTPAAPRMVQVTQPETMEAWETGRAQFHKKYNDEEEREKAEKKKSDAKKK